MYLARSRIVNMLTLNIFILTSLIDSPVEMKG